ncbi:MAG: tetratricopeptide repeat protein [Acidobacteria bacterium]|nr:tetratricopeptide repeat protein [Acidobacteriota bacterium]
MSPSPQDLVALYRMRYEMALEESKFDSALVFLNKILEVDPRNLEAKLQIGRIHHLHTREYSKAIAEYNKVIRLASDDAPIRNQARSSLSELIELVS